MGDTSNIAIGGATVDISGDIGFIKEGIVITPTFELYKVDGIEGMPAAVMARRTKTEYTVAFTMIEVTLANIKTFWDIQEAIGTVTIDLDIDAPAVVSEVVLIAKGLVPGADEFVRTFQFDRAIIESPGEMKISDYGEASIPVVFSTLYDTSQTPDRIGVIEDATA